VPAEGDTKPQEWKFFVLDRGGLWNAEIDTSGKTFRELHQFKLQFRANNDFRPRARYFYFHYVLAMLKIGRSKQKERAGSQSQMASATTPNLTKVWATGGRYLRENMFAGEYDTSLYRRHWA
jgi:hypothetical protein